jgi:3-oxoacyl-[acyl-carrier protein] reductase
MSSLENKVALITGASRGIGRAIGERLGHDGAAVGVNYRNRPEEAAEAVRAIEGTGGRARAFHADVARVAEIRRLFAEVAAAFGGIDIVVANAGLPFIGVPVVDVTEEDFDRVNAVNNKGSFFVMQEAARRVRRGGRIVDISSSTTFFTAAGMGVHAASKAGSKLIVEVLAAELGAKRITVNSVMPGATRTEFIKDAPQSELDRIAAGTPLGRLGGPDEIADIVAFLVSDQARWITGQHILANGGAKV